MLLRLDEVAKAALHGPEAAALVADSQELRRTSQGEVVAMLAEGYGLRPGLDVARATDVFLMLCGTEVYLSLQRAGWSPDDYVGWLVSALVGQLLGESRWP